MKLIAKSLGLSFVFVVLIIGVSYFALRYFNNRDKVVESGPAPTTEADEETVVSGDTTAAPLAISFTIAGDMMFDRLVDYTFRGEKIFDIMSEFDNSVFADKDIAMANLEGPISATDIPADGTRDSLVFNFPPKTPEALLHLGINSVSLANNHTMNNGAAGFANTKKVLTAAGIINIGKYSGVDAASVHRYTKDSLSVSVITVDVLAGSGGVDALIQSEKTAGAKVIVFPHWGTEYDTVHSASQSNLAHAWIDKGADMIIGSHPHVTQDAEIYKNRLIIYSLGNFLFDQTFSAETRKGLIVSGSFTAEKLEVQFLPVKSINIKPRLMTGDEKATATNKIITAIQKSAPAAEINGGVVKITF